MFKSFLSSYYNNNTELTDENIQTVDNRNVDDLMESFHSIDDKTVDDLMNEFHTVSEYEPTDCIPGVPLTRKGELKLKKGADLRSTILFRRDYNGKFRRN